MAQKHEFALYVPDLNLLSKQDTLILQNQEIIMRVGAVLRLQPGETCILFDHMITMRCSLQAIQKKSLTFHVLEKKQNQRMQPEIISLLPLLKRDDLEVALYAAVELGATVVQLVLTEKVQRAWGGAKELDRLQRIMIAAAEQSKNFSLPALYAPIRLPQALQNTHNCSAKLFFDIGGMPALKTMQELSAQKAECITFLVGPEGDLTESEKALVIEHQFMTCTLTPTILRAVSAFQLALGVVRSCL